MGKPLVSIVIPTKNGIRYINECLSAVFAQQCEYPYEVIVVDSGSTDGTIEIIEKFPAVLHRVAAGDFGHGKTRNLAAGLARGAYIVYMTQDTTPADSRWLGALVERVERDASVAGAFSMLIPRENCPMDEYVAVKVLFPGEDRIWSRSAAAKGVLFSNISSCIRKDVLAKIRFDDQCRFGEDRDWAYRAVSAGLTIAYCPASRAYHSHDESAVNIFRRCFDAGCSSVRSNIPVYRVFPCMGARIRLWREFMAQRKPGLWGGLLLMLNALNRVFAALCGAVLARVSFLLPRIVRQRISLVPWK
jgi:glycosyltransferase involved in cell wall biosynthesis